MQPFIVTLCGLLIYRGVARFYTADATAGFVFGQTFPWLEWVTTGRTLRRAALVLRHAGGRGGHVGGAAPLGLRALPLRRRQERGGGALRRRADRAGHRRGLRDLRGADRDRGDLLRHVHPLDLAGLARQLLRALRHRRGGARRLLAARRRGVDHRRGARGGAAAGAAEPRQPARHPELAQLRGDGLGDPVGVLADQQFAALRARGARCGRRPRSGRRRPSSGRAGQHPARSSHPPARLGAALRREHRPCRAPPVGPRRAQVPQAGAAAVAAGRRRVRLRRRGARRHRARQLRF